jgi:hypothetical protein
MLRACRLPRSLPPPPSGTKSLVCSKPTVAVSTSMSARCGRITAPSTRRRWHGWRPDAPVCNQCSKTRRCASTGKRLLHAPVGKGARRQPWRPRFAGLAVLCHRVTIEQGRESFDVSGDQATRAGCRNEREALQSGVCWRLWQVSNGPQIEDGRKLDLYRLRRMRRLEAA